MPEFRSVADLQHGSLITDLAQPDFSEGWLELTPKPPVKATGTVKQIIAAELMSAIRYHAKFS